MDLMAPPESIHIGADDLPFVDLGDGSKLKVLQVKRGENLWIIVAHDMLGLEDALAVRAVRG